MSRIRTLYALNKRANITPKELSIELKITPEQASVYLQRLFREGLCNRRERGIYEINQEGINEFRRLEERRITRNIIAHNSNITLNQRIHERDNMQEIHDQLFDLLLKIKKIGGKDMLIKMLKRMIELIE